MEMTHRQRILLVGDAFSYGEAGILGCCAVWFGNFFPTFRETWKTPSSTVSHWKLQMTFRIFKNIFISDYFMFVIYCVLLGA